MSMGFRKVPQFNDKRFISAQDPHSQKHWFSSWSKARGLTTSPPCNLHFPNIYKNNSQQAKLSESLAFDKNAVFELVKQYFKDVVLLYLVQ